MLHENVPPFTRSLTPRNRYVVGARCVIGHAESPQGRPLAMERMYCPNPIAGRAAHGFAPSRNCYCQVTISVSDSSQFHGSTIMSRQLTVEKLLVLLELYNDIVQRYRIAIKKVSMVIQYHTSTFPI